jgi:hypothetical protein
VNKQKKKTEINNRIRKVQKSTEEWLLERMSIQSYKVILNTTGVQLFEDGELSVSLPLEEIGGFIKNEELIVVAEDMNSNQNRLFFLRNSMNKQDFQVLGDFLETAFDDDREYKINTNFS